MLEKVSAIINERLKIQEGSDEFKQLISESFSDDNVEFIKDRSKIKMFDIFGEETKVDLVTDNTLTKSDAFDDNYHVQLNPDITDDDLTPLQNIDAFDDKYEAKYDHDLTTDNLLDKEVAYSDNQRTPVDITGYSAESSGLFNENYYAEEEENVEANLGKSATEEGSSKLDDTPAMFFENSELDDNTNSKIKLECGPEDDELAMFFEDDELTDIDNDSIDAGGDDMSTIEQPERADADQTTMGEPTVTQMMFEAADDECEECEEKEEDKDKKEKDDDEEEEDKKDIDVDDDEPEKAIEKLDDEDDDKEDKKDDEDEEEEKKSSFFFD